eukprot:TRINITY_DN15646_c0_g1_i1.p1 TRINITY_DN15646_c0_g1~~TRINITY_DN15646_c0_g1_i1.p1  ORF type:complete len:207 (+),score=23.89 TRINITY_DN15646_c0_g1_i1:116-736(+)
MDSRTLWIAFASLFSIVVGLSAAGAPKGPLHLPTPPIFGSQFVATGVLTYFNQQNISINASIWYDWDEKKCRVDSILGAGQIHAWMRVESKQLSYYLIILGSHVSQCFKSVDNKFQLPPPDLFNSTRTEWINREMVNGIYCDHWQMMHHLGRSATNIWVEADAPELRPVRITADSVQLDFLTYDVGHFDKSAFHIIHACKEHVKPN